MQVYSLLHSFFKELAPTWRKTQLANLTLLAQAILCQKSLSLAALARAYPHNSKPRVKHPKHILFHRLKRLRRFLNNPRPDLDSVFVRLTRLSYCICNSPGLLLPVLLDPTYFGHYLALVAAVPRSGRALPIAWRVFQRDLQGEPELSQNQIVENLVKEVVARISKPIQTVFIADRGFAIAGFFRFLKGLGKDFVIRVDKETWIRHPDFCGPLAQLPLKPGSKSLWFREVLYGKEEQVPLNLLAVWDSRQTEPWFLATSLDDPKLAERLYRKRMKIEHGFRDWKHHLRLKGTLRVESVERAGRLITAVALLYWFLSLVGMRLNRPKYQAEVSYWGKLSFFSLSLHLLQMHKETVAQAAQRVAQWAADKLLGLRPLTPAYKLRYRRFRHPSLPQTGSL